MVMILFMAPRYYLTPGRIKRMIALLVNSALRLAADSGQRLTD
jgi:hypothetical protein